MLLFTLCACTEDPEETVPTVQLPTVPAAQYYASAREAVENAENLVLEYTLREERVIGHNSFTSDTTGKASYSQFGKRDMTAVVEENLNLGAYSCAYAEAFCGRKAYVLVNGCCFRARISAAEFVDRQIPAVLLTESLYGSVTYGQEEAGVKISFSQPKSLESWVGDGKLTEASGTAVLDTAGNLIQTAYFARYSTDKVQYTVEVSVRITAPEALDLSAVHIAHEQQSVQLSDLDAPRRLVQVVADVYSAGYIACETTEKIRSEAAALTYDRSSRIVLEGTGQTLAADAAYEATVTNRQGTVTKSSQTEQFRDGVYTVSVDGGEPVRNGAVTAQAMRQYCEDTVLSGLMAVKYLQEVHVQGDRQTLCFAFTGNDSFCRDLMAQLTEVLQVDLDAKAQSAQTQRAGGYLTVDPETGLPRTVGMYLEREHTIDGVSYQLTYKLDENLTFTAE